MGKWTKERLFAIVVPRTEFGDHWVWTGGVGKNGYPTVTWKRGTQLLHRLIYIVCVGDIEPDYEVHHTCEIKRCWNPDHLCQQTKPRHRQLHRPTRCKYGHEFAVTGQTKKGQCLVCKREQHREYMKKWRRR